MLNHLEQHYERWRADNPKIMKLYMKYAQQAVDAGERCSIGLLTERVRWETMVKKTGMYKINNNFRAYIARDLVAHVPGFADLIQTRRVMGEAA